LTSPNVSTTNKMRQLLQIVSRKKKMSELDAANVSIEQKLQMDKLQGLQRPKGRQRKTRRMVPSSWLRRSTHKPGEQMRQPKRHQRHHQQRQKQHLQPVQHMQQHMQKLQLQEQQLLQQQQPQQQYQQQQIRKEQQQRQHQQQQRQLRQQRLQQQQMQESQQQQMQQGQQRIHHQGQQQQNPHQHRAVLTLSVAEQTRLQRLHLEYDQIMVYDNIKWPELNAETVARARTMNIKLHDSGLPKLAALRGLTMTTKTTRKGTMWKRYQALLENEDSLVEHKEEDELWSLEMQLNI
jgi:hypothetical protein